MNCDAARESISALLDGEQPRRDLGAIEAHLAICAGCRAWREEAHEVTRRVRVAAARPAPAADASLLAAVAAVDREQPWWATLAAVRVALVLIALAQLALNLPDLLSGSYRGAPIHVAHEMGAFDVAIAIGFIVAAWRPSRAQGMRALVGCAALLLAVTATIDILAGRTTVADESTHLLVVIGWLLLRRIALLAPEEREDGGLRLPQVSWQGWRRSPRLRPAAVAEPEPDEIDSEQEMGGARVARGA